MFEVNQLEAPYCHVTLSPGAVDEMSACHVTFCTFCGKPLGIWKAMPAAKISSACAAEESGRVVSQRLKAVLKVVWAQVALDEKVIMASGTLKVDGPKVIFPAVMKIWKVEVGMVPPSFVKWLLNQTISFTMLLPSLTL